MDVDEWQDDSGAVHMKIVVPGDDISADSGYVAGDGTYKDVDSGHIFASMAGVVHLQDKVIIVKPMSRWGSINPGQPIHEAAQQV